MNDLSIRRMLQTYIPKVLENDVYFRSYVVYLLNQYSFAVNEEHLRKKLNIYLKESHRTDPVALAQRLIRGEYKPYDKDKVNWIWLNSKEIGLIAHKILEVNRIH